MAEHHSDVVEDDRSKRSLGTKVRIVLGETLGKVECPYMRRWIFHTPFGSLRLHHFYRSDDKRAPHDHPFNFLTLILRGAYTDQSAMGNDHLKPGSIRYRPATHSHSVVVDYGIDNGGTKWGRAKGCWTLVLTGKLVRRWGFWVNGKWRKSNKYFLMYGHPACTDL